jgi:molecular chaperone HtpG
MLRGVIDSPDIPLNVSRSYLQADGAVKKISNYITKKVADKLQSIFKNERENLEQKWNDIKVVIEYGMLSEDKFYDKAKKFNLFPTTDGTFVTLDELKEQTKETQTDKDGKLIQLYAANEEEQHAYIQAAKDKGYTVLLLDSPIVGHLLQKIEQEDEKLGFVRVDADHIDKLIAKDEPQLSKLSDAQKEMLKPLIEDVVPKEQYTVQLEAMDSEAAPFMITQPEFMRRMKEMQQTGGGGMFGGGFPDMYQLVVNVNHPLVSQILETKTKKKQERLIKQSLDLARLSQSLLKGEELTAFIKRSFDMIK